MSKASSPAGSTTSEEPSITDVTVDVLFDESNISSDPVFIATLPQRETRDELGDVEVTRSNLQFSFFNPGELGVLTVETAEDGDFSTLMTGVCKHFGVDSVVFLNVISSNLVEAVDGFEKTERKLMGMPAQCLEGTWDVDRHL